MRPLVLALTLPAWLGLFVLAADTSSDSATASSSARSSNSVSISSDAPVTTSQVSNTASRTGSSLPPSSSLEQSQSSSKATADVSSTPSVTTSSLSQTFTTSYVVVSSITTPFTENTVTKTATSGLTTSTHPLSSPHNSKSSAIAAKAFIAVASTLGAAAVAASIWFLCKWHRRKKKSQEEAFEEALRQSQIHEEMSTIQRLSSQPSMSLAYHQHRSSSPLPTSPRAAGFETSPQGIVRSASSRSRRESWRSSPDPYGQRDSWRASPEPRRESWNSAEYQSSGGRFYAQQGQRPRPETIHENPTAVGGEEKK